MSNMRDFTNEVASRPDGCLIVLVSLSESAYYSVKKVIRYQPSWKPGCHDVITFDQNRAKPEGNGGVIHFGFRLQSPENPDAAAQEIERVGGTVLQQGEFAPGFPYLFIAESSAKLTSLLRPK